MFFFLLFVDIVEVNINCEIKTIRGVSYDIDRLPLLQKFKKDTKGCCMLNAEVSMEGIIITDNRFKNLKLSFSKCKT